MATTELADVAVAVQTFWGPRFDQKLRETFKLASLIDKTPGGLSSIRQGDTINVQQVNNLTGQLQPTTDCTFTPEVLPLQTVEVKCDQRAVASLEFCDLVELKSQVNLQKPEVRDAMAHAMNSQVNTHLYGKVAPTTTIGSTANIDASVLTDLTQQADERFWPEDQRWLLVDPQYRKDLLDDATLTSADFGASDRPVIGGQMVLERYGWKIVMDNSAAMRDALNASAGGVALAFIPTFMAMVMAHQSRVKISDRHSNDKFTVGMSIDTVFGAALSNDGADKHIVVKTGA